MTHVFVPFTAGSDERENEFAQSADRSPIRLITDGEYRNEGGLSKRRGFQVVTTQASGTQMLAGTLVGNGTTWGALRPWDFLPGQEGLNAGTTYGMPAVANHFRVQKAFAVHDGPALTRPQVAVARAGAGSSAGTLALACVVAARGTSETLLEIVNVDTGVVMRREILTDGSGVTTYTTARVAAATDNPTRPAVFMVFARNGTSGILRMWRYNITAAGLISGGATAITTPATTAGSTHDLQNAPGTNSVVLAFRNNSTNNLEVRRYDDSGAGTGSIAQAVTGAAPMDIHLSTADAASVHVVHSTSSTGDAYLETFDAALSARTLGSTQVFTGLTNLYGVSVALLTGTTTLVLVADSRATVPVTQHKTIVTDHTGLSSAVSINSAVPVTRPLVVRYGTGVARAFHGLQFHDGSVDAAYFPTTVLSQIPRGAGLTLDGFTASSSGAEHGGTLWNDASVLPTGGPVPGWALDPTTGYYYTAVVNAVEYDGTASGGLAVSQSSIAVVRLQPAADGSTYSPGPMPTAVLENVAYVGGPLLRFFDGVNFGEVVPMPPMSLTLAQGVGTNLAAGTYSYCAVLVWEDAAGNVHRSAPCPVVSRVHAGTNGIVATLKVHGASMLDLDCGGQQWRAELYRTQAGGSTFYYRRTAAAPLNASLVFTEDTLSDATLATHRTLYTTGDVLQNEPPPAVAALCAHRGRLWAISAQDPQTLVHSKVKEEGVAPEFNGALSVRLDEPAVSLVSMDEKLVVFTDRGAYIITGDGPDARGTGVFALERVEGSAGASGPKAAVTFPHGILVHSKAGFQLFGRDLATTNADMLRTTFPATYRIGRGIHFPAKEQVWFIAESVARQGIVVYDYSDSKVRVLWWKFRSASYDRVLDVVDVGGVPYLAVYASSTEAPAIYAQSATSFADGTTFVPFAVDLAWFYPDQLDGDNRFRRFRVHGYTPPGAGGCTLTASVYALRPNESNTAAINAFAWTNLEAPGAPLFYRQGVIQDQRGIGVRASLVFSSSGTANVEGPTLHGVAWDFAVRQAAAKQAPAVAP